MLAGCVPEVELYQTYRREVSSEVAETVMRHLLGCSLCHETWRRFELDAQVARGIRCALHGDAAGADAAHERVPVRELPEDLSIPGFVIEPGCIEGGQARVYRGVYEASEEEVAIKVFHNSALNEGGSARFTRELRSLSRLRHRNVVPIRSDGEVNGHPYFVMPWIEGLTLDAYVQEHNLTDEDKATLAAKICDALRHAHNRGVLHLDLKPSNVRVDSEGEPVVLDFGLARIAGGDAEPSMPGMRAAGTPAYMAPEQVNAQEDVDVRADVYSLGLLMYEVLTGRRAKDTGTGAGRRMGMEIASEQPVAPREVCVGVNRELEAITLRAIAPRRRDRYQSAEQFHDDLQRFVSGKYVLAMGPGWPYRLRKLATRHLGVLLVLAAFVSLCGITLGVKWETEQMAQQASERVGQLFQLAPEESSATLELAGAYRTMGKLCAELGMLDEARECSDYARRLRNWVATRGESGVPPLRPSLELPPPSTESD